MDNRLVFVVEDDASVAEAFAEVLRQGGFQVEVFGLGTGALNSPSDRGRDDD